MRQNRLQGAHWPARNFGSYARTVAQMIMEHKSAPKSRTRAEKEGMVLMWEDGFIKAVKGMTTIEEIVRVSKE